MSTNIVKIRQTTGRIKTNCKKGRNYYSVLWL